MSLVSGYPPQPYPAGPISHDFYSYHHQNRYQDHADAGYFQGWMLNGQNDMVMSPESYDMGSMSVGDYSGMGMFHTITTNDGHGGTVRIRCVKRRTTANKKERRRTLSINSAFANLRGCIPNVPSDTKLSKIKTLRLATSYIAYLMDILAKDDPTLTEGGFKAEITKKVETREEKRKREAEEIAAQSSSNSPQGSEKKSKGRTGWPQHVWASELKQ